MGNNSLCLVVGGNPKDKVSLNGVCEMSCERNRVMSCVFLNSDQVQHKLGFTATGNGYSLEVLDLRS